MNEAPRSSGLPIWPEPLLIVLVVALVPGWSLPASIGPDRLILMLAALLLGQGLVRDVAILAHRLIRPVRKSVRATNVGASPRPPVACLCLESVIGLTAIVVGAALMSVTLEHPAALGMVALDPWSWAGAIGLVLALGWAGRELVVVLRPLRIVRDPDHLQIVLWRPPDPSDH